MTKSEMLGKRYKLKVGRMYYSTTVDDEVYFPRDTVFEITNQFGSLPEDEYVNLKTMIDGRYYEVPYCTDSIERHIEIWKEDK